MTIPSSDPPSTSSPVPDLPLPSSVPAASPAGEGTPPRSSLPPLSAPASRLKPLHVRGRVLTWAIAGVITSGSGLLLITGLAGTPWLFLLYPLLIGLLLASLSAIALHLLHRF